MMNIPPLSPPSPIHLSFRSIDWTAPSLIHKLKISAEKAKFIAQVEAAPLDLLLSDFIQTQSYIQLLLKCIAESVGTSGPSAIISTLHSDTIITDESTLEQLLETDPMGVVTHSIISQLYEILTLMPGNAKCIKAFYPKNKLLDEWRPLLRVLHLGGNGDIYAQRGAALCLAVILSLACPSQQPYLQLEYNSVEEPLQALISWIASQLQSSSTTSLKLATPPLVYLMGNTEARHMFSKSGGIGYLSRHLRSGSRTIRGNLSSLSSRNNKASVTVQQLYELCFCLWTMTYECNTSLDVRACFARDGAIPALVDLLSTAAREKVVRVALSALRNLSVVNCNNTSSNKFADDTDETKVNNNKLYDGSYFLSEMTQNGLMKLIDGMKERQWTDPDMVDDILQLYKLLHENHRELSRWDLYKAEVESGSLRWGAVHTEAFFRENAVLFEGSKSDFKLLKRLITMVSSHDDDIAAIACFDLGEFVRHYPNGRSIAKRLGAKDSVMSLIDHPNDEVQRQALLCISKIMVQKWEFVNQ